MINLTSLKCPECGSILDIPENKEFFFCQFCGARIMLNNNNEKIIHKVDEAELKRAETEEKVKMLEMELKLKELENTEKHKKKMFKAKLITIFVFICIVILFALLALLFKNTNENAFGAMLCLSAFTFFIGSAVACVMFSPYNK